MKDKNISVSSRPSKPLYGASKKARILDKGFDFASLDLFRNFNGLKLRGFCQIWTSLLRELGASWAVLPLHLLPFPLCFAHFP